MARRDDWWIWITEKLETLEMKTATFDSKIDSINKKYVDLQRLLEVNNQKAVDRYNKMIKSFETIGEMTRKEHLDMLETQAKHRRAFLDVVETLEKRVNEERRYVDNCMTYVKDVEDRFLKKLDNGLEKISEELKEEFKEDIMKEKEWKTQTTASLDSLEKKWSKAGGAIEKYVDERVKSVVKEIDNRVQKIWEELDECVKYGKKRENWSEMIKQMCKKESEACFRKWSNMEKDIN